MNTELYDEVDEYRTLDYTKTPYRQEQHNEQLNQLQHSSILKLLHQKKDTCLIYVGFKLVIYSEDVQVIITVRLIC